MTPAPILKRKSLVPVALKSPFGICFSAAFSPTAALCKKSENPYLRFFNGLNHYSSKEMVCQPQKMCFFCKTARITGERCDEVLKTLSCEKKPLLQQLQGLERLVSGIFSFCSFAWPEGQARKQEPFPRVDRRKFFPRAADLIRNFSHHFAPDDR